MDVLPYAYQLYNHNWLPNDWYLNLKIEYRYLFSYVTGFFVDQVGFFKTAYAGRLLTYILFSISFIHLLRSLKIRFEYGFGALLIFLALFRQSLGLKEWMVGGFETKTIAYTFILLALSNGIRKQYLRSFFFAGFSFSFHVLVGSYGLVGLVISLLLTEQDRLSILKSSWIILLSGFWGFYNVSQYFFGDGLANSTGWAIYVNYRVPHHTLPHWELWKGIVFILCVLLNIFWLKNSKNKTLVVYSLTSVAFATIGIFIYFFGPIEWLRFYFFRFSDSIFLLLTLLGIASYSQDISWNINVRNSILALTTIVLLLVYYSDIKRVVTTSSKPIDYSFDSEMAQWIQKHTPKESVFCIPTEIKDFYVFAERAVFVTQKHAPQKASDIEKWYQRIQEIHGGLERSNDEYNQLTKSEINDLAKEYGLDYIIFPASVNLDLSVNFKTEKYTLYQINY